MDTDDPAVRARTRAASAGRRARQLEARRAAMNAHGNSRGSTQANIDTAAEALAEAQRQADNARRSAKQSYLRAISAHERAATRHDLAADMAIGDVPEHRRRAAEHRAQANADRATVALTFDDID